MSSTRALIIIVLAQLLGTSLWFSGNSAAAELAKTWNLNDTQKGYLLTSVQIGFIAGTLGIALSGLADAFAASRIFAVSALFGACANAGFALLSQQLETAIFFRFFTGLALAGIYPLGMKLVVTWAPQQSGSALGWLVGALTLGTASPHLIRGLGQSWPWQGVVLTSSGLALLAAVAIALLGDGPARPKRLPPQWGAVLAVFRRPAFRASAFGYFGHMWELYAFWFLAPVLVRDALRQEPEAPLWVFAVIGSGAVGCVLGGLISRRWGSFPVAFVALLTSGALCAIYPVLPANLVAVRLAALCIWGVAVVADSPQFSALSAKACPVEAVGAALSVQNGMGFLITVAAIQMVAWQWPHLGRETMWLLAPGPILGLAAMWWENRG